MGNLSKRQSELTETVCPADLRTAKLTRPKLNLHQACENGDLCMVIHILKQDLEDIYSRANVRKIIIGEMKRHVSEFASLVRHVCRPSKANNNLLHAACKAGNIDMVRYLLVNKEYDIESRGHGGYTPAMYAVYFGHRSVLSILMKHCCNVTAVSYQKMNLLHIACWTGQVDMVKHILSQGVVGIEGKEMYGGTALMLAASNRNKKAVDILISRGCNVLAENNLGENVLHLVCKSGHVDMVQYFLDKSEMDIDSRDLQGKTPAMHAAFYGYVEIVDLLIRNGCNEMARDLNGDNILHFACSGCQINVMKYIITKGTIGLESRDDNGRTPVIMATHRSNVTVIDFLVKQGCNLRAQDIKGYTPLHIACYRGDVALVKYFLTLSTKELLNIRHKGGLTPLQVANKKGYKEIVDLLTV